MPLGTLDRTPPPFFRQGPSALTKLAVFSALAVFLMAADSRLKYTQPIRAALATVLLPIQRSLLVPVELVEGGSEYLQGLNHAIASERDARAKLVAQAERATRVEQLADRKRPPARAARSAARAHRASSRTAEVLYEATDPYSRKVFIDRGSTQGVLLGSPVINDAGVLGQVTRVYPLSAEITLLADKDAAIPVLNPRTQQRSAAFGSGDGDLMELRFMAGNADVQPGDLLITSGVDGVYPPGLVGGHRGQGRSQGGLGLCAHQPAGQRARRRRASRAGARPAGDADAAAAGAGGRRHRQAARQRGGRR